MRITGGSVAGLSIKLPQKMPHTRPTTQKLRQALLNVLDNRLNWDSVCLLDLFAGTGIFSYECMSRGIEGAYIVEKNPMMAKFITKQLQNFKFSSNSKIIIKDVIKFLSKPLSKQFELIIADPPYDFPNYQLLHQLVFSNNFLKPHGLYVIEHSYNLDLSNLPNYLMHRRHGDGCFTIFVNDELKLN